MYRLIVSAFNFLLGFVLRTLVIKFVVFSALFLIVSEFVPVILNLLPASSNLPDLINQLPNSVWYFMNLFAVITGLKIVISAFLTRFIIRRIPIIG
ncbi:MULTISPECIES: DUF2523 family protein [Morganellaceae]|uniref:DUF2523 family protein n=1 Tax=Morganellaceae TaxID=1903414 RepID=UPI0010BE56CE|nr:MULTISPECIES: DUF2523 family protein [Morganellaceae]QCJ70053.1 DUF2523 domain-containing protein [Providencia heimbachae]QCJ70065.1 DUF2523 domain-containing protein [Providencia heimbachae]QCJ70075.1 DUF2523 domain-containing protein [Providencia heimbachae]QCJ70087.1 DUF2523 domain-containing protein [Providencia heimbachae]QCJ70099.1 DUF2523 domain-containing protein [Providencia heimbachae]